MGTTTRPMKRADRKLLRRLKPSRLKQLSVDELITVHKKVRKARTRQQQSLRQRRKKEKARAVESARLIASRYRVLLFEEALADVSAELARTTRRRAATLREQWVDGVRAKKTWRSGDAGRARPDDSKSHGRIDVDRRSVGRSR